MGKGSEEGSRGPEKTMRGLGLGGLSATTSRELEELLGHGHVHVWPSPEPGVGRGRAVTDACVLWDQSFNLYPFAALHRTEGKLLLSF